MTCSNLKVRGASSDADNINGANGNDLILTSGSFAFADGIVGSAVSSDGDPGFTFPSRPRPPRSDAPAAEVVSPDTPLPRSKPLTSRLSTLQQADVVGES